MSRQAACRTRSSALRRPSSRGSPSPKRLCVRSACFARPGVEEHVDLVVGGPLVLLGQAPSLRPLHPLEQVPEGLVSAGVGGPRWYYGPVRLPGLVHRRRPPCGFTPRTRVTTRAEPGISRLPIGRLRPPREVLRCVRGEARPPLGALDHAGCGRRSRCRGDRCCLPSVGTTSAPRSIRFSRLNTRPAPAPVNASPPPSRAATHDSEPTWLATPSSHGTLIHNTSPAWPAHPDPFDSPGSTSDRHGNVHVGPFATFFSSRSAPQPRRLATSR